MIRLPLSSVLLAAVALTGCDLPKLSVNLTAPVLAKAADNFEMESDVQLARDAAAGQLKTADGFLASAPENRALLEVLARGYFEYGFGFVEDDIDLLPDDESHHAKREELAARATNFYDRAVGFALRDLATYDKAILAASKKDTSGFEAVLAKMPKSAAPAMLYGGMAWASGINLNRSDITRVGDLPKAIALVKRSYALDKRFYNGAAGMTLGLIAASQGKAMGGDPDGAKRYFDEAIALTSGNYLLAKVMQARFYAVQIQDRALFERVLKDVIAADAAAMPSQRLANELAKRRAVRYLAHAEDFF